MVLGARTIVKTRAFDTIYPRPFPFGIESAGHRPYDMTCHYQYS